MAGICKFSAFLESGIPQAYSDVDGFLWLRTLEIFFLVIVALVGTADEEEAEEAPSLFDEAEESGVS